MQLSVYLKKANDTRYSGKIPDMPINVGINKERCACVWGRGKGGKGEYVYADSILCKCVLIIFFAVCNWNLPNRKKGQI